MFCQHSYVFLRKGGFYQERQCNHVNPVFMERRFHMKTYVINDATLRSDFRKESLHLFNKQLKNLSPNELNCVISNVVRDKIVASSWEDSLNMYSEKRISIYFSIEYLLGRTVLDVLNNTGVYESVRKVLKEEGIDIRCLEEVDDTALGNGGLGRLAACFVESAASMKYLTYGVGVYYKYGLFKQKFNYDGWQVEEPDDWTANGDPWFVPYRKWAIPVKYSDTEVLAVPMIMPVVGFNPNKDECNSHVNPLMLWKSETIPGITNSSAAAISDWLYPNDSTDEGKILRLRQEYFFTSATMQLLVKLHLEKHNTLDNFEDYYVFQMNDTHPVLASLEFIRLLKLHGYTFDEAFAKAQKCFAYTNHTVMSEALEKWPMYLFKNLLPDIYKIIEELNQKLIDTLIVQNRFCFTKVKDGHIIKEPNWRSDIDHYELSKNGEVKMAHIACFMGKKINGVAKVHSDIIKDTVLHRWYELYPDRFLNITNGVTPRRWINLANPPLADLLDKYLGNQWVTDLSLLENLKPLKEDETLLSSFAEVKRTAKLTLTQQIEKCEHVQLNPDSLFDVQVKRFHEYKRQLMNAMRILYFYDKIKSGQLQDFYPTTFIFGGKAAASYEIAKLVMQLIKDIQEMVNNDPAVNGKIKVVLVTNFNVSYSEYIYPAADISEQISLAGTEASGTSNMKMMMNGAVTLGTLDGANIEIVDAAGESNNYIFGATVDVLKGIQQSYNHNRFLNDNYELKELIKYLKGERRGLKRVYWRLANELEHVDKYKVMYDLKPYIDIFLRANRDYATERNTGNMAFFTQKQLINIASSGNFSSDRTIREYAEKVWGIEPV